MAEKFLDVTGLSCPLPILKARKTLRDMTSGQTLEVHATDPASVEDFPIFCGVGGHQLLESSTIEGGIYRFVIKKGDQTDDT